MTEPFHHGHYRINIFFLSILGLWPYQTRAVRLTRSTFFMSLVGSVFIPQILASVKFRNNTEMMILSLPPVATVVAFFIKYTNVNLNSEKMYKLLERMRFDWTYLMNRSEISILHEYAAIGRKLTIAYTAGLYFAMVVFLCEPAIPKVLEVLKLTNGSGPPDTAFPVYYGDFDIDSHYTIVWIHGAVTTMADVTTYIAVDTMFIVHVQHACGIFAIVGCQLQRIGDEAEKSAKIYSRPKDDAVFQYVVHCIKKHKEAIEFAELVESSYTWLFFAIVGINMIMISASGYQTMATMETNPKQSGRFAIFTITEMSHLFVLSFFSQKLRDHSEQVRKYVSQSQWHSTSLCAQKLIGLVIMRADTPCELTAGGFLVMSLENFAMVLKTSMSYFTLMRTSS